MIHMNGSALHICSFGVVQVEDTLFAAGEALSFLWGTVPVTADIILKSNYASLSTTSKFLSGDVSSSLLSYSPEEIEASESCHAMVRDAITRKLFDVLLYSNRKDERCAGTVWLLSLTMYCGHHPSIQKMLPEIQVCPSCSTVTGQKLRQLFHTHKKATVEAKMKGHLYLFFHGILKFT